MITITWFGTASILIEACGQKLLFDPFVELNGGSNPNTLEDFEGVGDICVTHGHLDHLFFVPEPVSYTHLDVYKRQACRLCGKYPAGGL